MKAPTYLKADRSIRVPESTRPKVGDFVTTCDGSYAATIRKNGLEHNCINMEGYRQRFNWRLVAINCVLPAVEARDEEQNDAVIIDQNSGDVVFIKHEFLVKK